MTFDISKANVEWVEKKSSRQAGGEKNPNSVVVSAMKCGKGNDGAQRYTNAVTIPNEAMVKNRLMKGDKVMIGVSVQEGKKYLVVTRTLDGRGFSISKPHVTSKNGYVKFGNSSSLSKLAFPERLECPILTMTMFSNGFAVEVTDNE